MRPMLSLITASTFLLHVWLGCCAHHAHAAGETHEQHAAEASGHAPGGHDHGTGTRCDHSSEDVPWPPTRCADGHCDFLAVAKSGLAKLGMTAVPHVAVGDAVAGFHAVSAANLTETREPVAPPERVHLLHQVFLI